MKRIQLTVSLLLLASPFLAAAPMVDVGAVDHDRILRAADAALKLEPVTITAFHAPLSPGGPNDFYSNSDYRWPNPDTTNGLPYILRDGESNPNNFNEHRRVMRILSDAVAALGAAYRITGDDRYAKHADELLRVFFLDEKSRMNPSLQYAQSVPGITMVHGSGVIDSLHLVEIPKAVEAMQKSPAFSANDLAELKKWFADYIVWLRTSKNGIAESKAVNNHSVAYWLQVAVFAEFTGDEGNLGECRRQFTQVFLPKQMTNDGSFPRELQRTKPYGYSIFQMDNMATLCQVLSGKENDLWNFSLRDGRNIHKAMEYMYPFLADKSKWTLKPDVQTWDAWPARQPGLLFAGIAFHESKYLELWKKLPADPADEEVRRNIAITQPILWLNDAAVAAPKSLGRTVISGQKSEDVSVSVVRGSNGIHVDSTFAGFGYEKGYLCIGTFDPANKAQVALFKRLGPSVVRIGANQADDTQWDPSAKGFNFRSIAPSDVDRLAGFLRACNWRAIYAVRFVNNTPAKAAEEAAYVAKALGDRLLAFEVGNEPDHYCYLATEVYHRHFIGPVNINNGRFRPLGYGCHDFAAEWQTFVDAIALAVPHALFVGPSCGGAGVDKGGKDEGWAKTFAFEKGQQLALLTTHYYISGPTDTNKATMDYMLNPADNRITNMLERLRTWSRAAGIQGGFHLDEAGSYFGGGKAGLSDTHASALWMINFLFTCAQNDACRGVSIQIRGHVPYTPIAFEIADNALDSEEANKPGMKTAIQAIRPEYYGMLLFNMAVGGTLQQTVITGSDPGHSLSAYAVAAAAGSMRVVLVNTSSTTAFDATVDLAAKTKEATLTRLTGSSLESSTETLLGGAAVGTDGSWNPKKQKPMPTPDGRFKVSVQPFSAVLVQAK